MRRSTNDELPQPGKFVLGDNEEFFGQLTLKKGSKSLLLLRDDHYVPVHNIPDRCIKGVLNDLTRVSLLHCNAADAAGSASRGNEGYSFAEVFPQFVVSGDRHIGPTDKTIGSIHFVISDATALFYDFDAFGHLIGDSQNIMKQIAEAQEKVIGRKIKTGPDSEIFYFSGRLKIFSAETVLGTISASHRPAPPLFHGPRGLHVPNTIFVTIDVDEPIDFEEAIHRTMTVYWYLGLLIGRQQNLEILQLDLSDQPTESSSLDVYWANAPTRDESTDSELGPQSSDVLLDAIREPEKFALVTERWLARNESWRDARGRFFGCFAKQRHYDIDRLIGAANMFDISPPSASSDGAMLSSEAATAKKAAREIFLRLPNGPEREDMLNGLGRIGKSKLKQKIRNRVAIIREADRVKFPELDIVADEAVKCRNHYVHGGEAKIDYEGRFFETAAFFTDTLEFVFAASDLIESGWSINEWLKRGGALSHPFAMYKNTYEDSLGRLKQILKSE